MTNDIIKTAAAVYMDTSSLMLKINFINFLKVYVKERQLIIPGCVRDQLVKLSREDSQKGKQAQEALEIIDELYKHCFYLEQTGDLRPAQFFIRKAEERKNGLPILVVTQSADLAYALNIRRAKGYGVAIKRLTADGFPANFDHSKLPPSLTVLSRKTNASDVIKNLI